jgi:HlyD family secretion protein
MRHRRTIVWGSVAIVLIAGIGTVAASRRTSLRATSGDTPIGVARRGDLDLKVFATGELRAEHSMMLPAPAVGGGALQITRLLHAGSLVKKGDIIIEFDPSEQHYKLDQNRSELLQAEEQITKAKADAAVQAAQDKVALLKARFEVRRAQLEVQKNELVSSIDAKKNDLALEQANRVLSELEQDIKSHTASGQATILLAEEKRNKAKLAMDQARQNIEKMRVSSPMAGLVSIEKNRDAMGGFMWDGMPMPDYQEGDQVQPGRPIAQVIDSQKMAVVSKIGENDRGNMKTGQPAQVEFDALPGRIFHGTVRTVGGMSVRNFWEQDVGGKFDVFIELSDSASLLRPGLTAQVVFLGEGTKNVISVPRQALFLKGSQHVVYVKNGVSFEQREVQIQSESESRAAIQGVEAGTQVALVDPTAPRKTGNSGTATAGGATP